MVKVLERNYPSFIKKLKSMKRQVIFLLSTIDIKSAQTIAKRHISLEWPRAAAATQIVFKNLYSRINQFISNKKSCMRSMEFDESTILYYVSQYVRQTKIHNSTVCKSYNSNNTNQCFGERGITRRYLATYKYTVTQ